MGQKVVTMEQKMAAVFTSSGTTSVTQACAELGISRQTYYHYRRRFAVEGLAGLVPRSRAPHSSPRRTDEVLVELVVQARKQLEVEGWDNGAISIRHRLLFDGVEPPSARTVHRILVRSGLVEPDPAKRPRSSYRRFTFPATDDCWQIDAFVVVLADPAMTAVVVFQLLDDHSRFDLADLAWPLESTEGAWACMTAAVQRYGLPRMVLSDNGLAFTGRRVGQQVLFERNLAALGVKTIHSRPFHPQTNGKNERSHQTLQRWLSAQPAPTTIEQLQHQLDQYRPLYNQRPHQGLAGASPLQQRALGTRLTPLPPTNPAPLTLSTVSTIDGRGNLNCHGYRIRMGLDYVGQQVTAFLTGSQLLVFHREHQIYNGRIDPARRIQSPNTRPGPRSKPKINPT
jgi:transposase InsO family protein